MDLPASPGVSTDGQSGGGGDTGHHCTGEPTDALLPFTMAAVTVGSRGVRVQTRLLLLLPLLSALLLCSAAPGMAARQPVQITSPAVAREDSRDALQVTIDQLSPTALAPGDEVQVSGTITNVDDSSWATINAFLVMSAGALSTAQELQDAANSPDTSYIGDRIVEDGAFDSVGDLEPGQSVGYSVEVPYRQLGISGADGVYQLGVHVIGTDADGFRSMTATGRARSFLPSLDAESTAQVRTAVLWPLLARVRRVPNGGVANVDWLVELCAPGGRLRTMLDLARINTDAPMTLLVDPGLLNALAQLARGVLPDSRSEITDDEPEQPIPSSAPTTGTPQSLAEYVRTEPVDSESTDQQTVRIWLRDLLELAGQTPVWATGYAEPDLAALPTDASPDDSADPVNVGAAERLRTAADRATVATLRSLGLTAARVWWPPRGVADERGLTRAAAQVNASVLTASALPDRSPTTSSTLTVDIAGGAAADVVVDDAAYLDGGPGPGDTNSALQVRQRIAAETALLSLALTSQGRRSGNTTVVLGRAWQPGGAWAAANFDDAFTTPWSRPTTLSAQLDTAENGYRGDQLTGPDLADPLPASVVDQAALLDRRSRVLGELLRDPSATDSAALFYDEVTATTISQRWRSQPEIAERFGRRSARNLAEQLGSVSVEIPSYVTLSSDSGSFGVTINNGMQQAATVGVDFKSRTGRFSLPDIEPIAIGAGESRTVLVDASVSKVALDVVTARLVTLEGSTFGPPTRFTLRTSPLGVVIWIALGTGAAFVLLVVARRSLRQRRAGR